MGSCGMAVEEEGAAVYTTAAVGEAASVVGHLYAVVIGLHGDFRH
jgi:hypothetical protein